MMSHRSVLQFGSFILSLCLSTSSSLHLFVLWFNFRITSQEQSSAAIPPHDGVSRNTKRRQWKRISYTKSVLCFYWIMKNLWQQFDLVYHFQLGSCSACLRYSAALEYLALWGVGGEQSMLCDAPLIPNHSFESSKKIRWLKFIFDTVIIKLLKTIKSLPIPPFS